MKLVYMGTPDFAALPLEALAKAGYEIGYVLTRPDAERDRGKKVKPSPVKQKAAELGLRVLQPETVKGNRDLQAALEGYGPDVMIAAAYGQILPKAFLDLPKWGCVNLHASLLPRFRGAAPVQGAILAGDRETGVTLMRMEEGLDTGAMLARRSTPVGRKTAGQLQDELSAMGAELLVETLPQCGTADWAGEPQKEEEATYAPKFSKKDAELDFTRDPERIERQVRAFNPWPGAFTAYEGQRFKIWEGEADSRSNGRPAGTITEVTEAGIEISAGGKTFIARVIQVPGKKPVRVKDYLKGNTIEKNSVLG